MEKTKFESLTTIAETAGVIALLAGAELALSSQISGIFIIIIGLASCFYAHSRKSPDVPFRPYSTLFSLCASVFVGAFKTAYTVELALVSGLLGYIITVIKLYLEADIHQNGE